MARNSGTQSLPSIFKTIPTVEQLRDLRLKILNDLLQMFNLIVIGFR